MHMHLCMCISAVNNIVDNLTLTQMLRKIVLLSQVDLNSKLTTVWIFWPLAHQMHAHLSSDLTHLPTQGENLLTSLTCSSVPAVLD